MKSKIISIALILLTGCAALQKGADPIVVRCEQTLAFSKATLDTFETLDHANREFFKTNAAPMHAFAEFLRAPVVVNQTNLLPRGLAYIFSLEATKEAYKKGKASSNLVATAAAVLETAINQAQFYISAQQPITK